MTKQKSPQALAAAAIRKELKANFPKTKFEVRSSSFAGGDAVDIRYTDGPTYTDVNTLVSKYQYGSFDGMTDMYEYDNTNNDLPQAKYVQVQRSMSVETRDRITSELVAYYGIENPNDMHEWMDKLGQWKDAIVGREFSKQAL